MHKKPPASHVYIDLGADKENPGESAAVARTRRCSKDSKVNNHQKSVHNTSIAHSLSRTVIEETQQVPAAEVGKYLIAINNAQTSQERAL